MANPLPLATLGVGALLASFDSGPAVTEFVAIVGAAAAVAVATKFWKMSKAVDALTAQVKDVHLRLDKLDVPQSDGTVSGA